MAEGMTFTLHHSSDLRDGWNDRADIPIYNFTPEHYFDLMLL